MALSIVGDIATFADGTGQLIQDSGVAVAALASFKRTAITAVYSVQTSDAGKTLGLGGNAFYTVTVPAAAGFSNSSVIILANEDASRGKRIAVNIFGTFILWPRQIAWLINLNSVWFVMAPDRWRPTSAPTFNVDNVNGSDNSDGLGTGAGAFATVQQGVNVCYNLLDINSQAGATIQLPTTTSTPITENVNFAGSIGGTQFDLFIQGNPSTPADCQWFLPTGASGQPCVQIADFATVTLKGIDFGVTSGAVPALVAARQLCIVDLDACRFSNNPTQVAVKLQDGARCNVLSQLAFAGNYAAAFQILDTGGITASGINFDAPVAINVGTFAQAIGAGANFSMDGMTFTSDGNWGGARYNIDGPSCIQQSGVSWPTAVTSTTLAHGGVAL